MAIAFQNKNKFWIFKTHLMEKSAFFGFCSPLFGVEGVLEKFPMKAHYKKLNQFSNLYKGFFLEVKFFFFDKKTKKQKNKKTKKQKNKLTKNYFQKFQKIKNFKIIKN